MSAGLLVVRLVLAAVFAVAGATKLADLPGSRAAVRGFGAPAALAGVLGVALPLAELAIAVLLLPASTAWWGALGALALLLVFCAVIAANLARGRQPDCHCFGQLHSEPAGRRTLARNGALAALALVVVVAGRDDVGPGALAWIGDLEAAEAIALGASAVAVVAVAGAAALALRLLRAHGRLLLRIDALEARLDRAGLELPEAELDDGPLVGEPAPDFALPALDGTTVTRDAVLASGRPALVVFSHPDCGPCRELAPALADWEARFADELEVVLVTGGTADKVRDEFGHLRPDRVLLEAGEDVAVSVEYEAGGTPAAVLVAASGIVVGGPAGGRSGVEELLGRGLALARASRPEGLAPGSPAPDLVLSDLDGAEVRLAEPRPTGAVVVFWNPSCGYCQSLRPDLLAWEQRPPEGAPELLLLSSADPGALAAEGFRSHVLHDPDGAAMAAFQAAGTPVAVRLEPDGTIGSYLATGASEVLALAGAAPRLELHRRHPAATP